MSPEDERGPLADVADEIAADFAAHSHETRALERALREAEGGGSDRYAAAVEDLADHTREIAMFRAAARADSVAQVRELGQKRSVEGLTAEEESSLRSSETWLRQFAPGDLAG